MPKTKNAFALRGLYEDFVRWEEEYQKFKQEPMPPNSSEEYFYDEILEGKSEGWFSVVEKYLPENLYSLYSRISTDPLQSKLDEFVKLSILVNPYVDFLIGNQVLKRIERHIGRLQAYSQKIFANVLAQGFNETLRTKGNRVNELISEYRYIADFFKDFCEVVIKCSNLTNEEFQKKFRLEFGQRLKQARKKAKLTQQKLAELVGLKTFNAIAQYERGISDPSLPTLYRISKILNCSADWLLGLK